MPWQAALKKLALSALCGLLLWLCASICLVGPALSAQTQGAQTDRSGQQEDGQSEGSTQEQSSGFYLAPRFLYQWQNHIDQLTISVNGLSSGDGTFHSQASAGGALAVGYDFWPGHKLPFRAELELALRGNSQYSKEASFHGGRQSEKFKSQYNATTLLANFYYDYHNRTSFVPYLAVGAGLALVYGDFNYQARVASEEFRVSDSQHFSNFAWSVGSGIAWSYSERLSIDLGYRYLNLGAIEFSGTGKFGQAVSRYKAEDLGSLHEISLGLRFTF